MPDCVCVCVVTVGVDVSACVCVHRRQELRVGVFLTLHFLTFIICLGVSCLQVSVHHDWELFVPTELELWML